MTNTSRLVMRWAEFILLYFAVPLFFAFHRRYPPLVFLFLLSLFSLLALYRSTDFRNTILLNKAGLLQEAPRILRRFALISAILFVFTLVIYPDCLFFCPIHHFSLWLSLMVF